MLHSICQQIWKTQQWPQDRKRAVFIPIPKKGNAKECSNYHTIALISHTRKIMLKILQARLQQSVDHELPDVQARFRKGRGTRDQIANIHWISQKASKPQRWQLTTLTAPPYTLVPEEKAPVTGCGVPWSAQNQSTNRSPKRPNTSSQGSSFMIREISSPIIRYSIPTFLNELQTEAPFTALDMCH